MITGFSGDKETFESFRIDLHGIEASGKASDLETLSGFKVIATVTELEATCPSVFPSSYRSDPTEGEA